MNKSFIHFEFVQTSPSGKTDIYNVVTLNGVLKLGVIMWYSPWRKKYVFYPENDTLFDPNCLREIADFVEDLNQTKKSGYDNRKAANGTKS